jgi:predicted metal-dependent hydrolase
MTHTLCLVSHDPSALVQHDQLTDFAWLVCASLKSFVEQVVQAQPILILIDARVAQWAYYSEAVKSSNATRRIPTLLISDDASEREQAFLHGVDQTISWANLLQDPRHVVQSHANIPDEAYLEALACGCQEALPARAIEGIQKFNDGEYYAQHDLFEAQWMHETAPVRDLYRAILQVGVGYYQIERGNYRGALKTLQKSVQWLMLLPDVCQGVDVKQLRDDSLAVRAHLLELGAERIHEFDKTRLKGVKYTP